MTPHDRLRRSAADPAVLRGTGRTHRAIEGAPERAVYIAHPVSAAQLIRDRIGRRDVHIYSADSLSWKPWSGTNRQVIVDHALELTEQEAEDIHRHNATVVARRERET